VQGTLLGATPVAGTPAAIAAAGGAQTQNVQNAVSTSAPLDELQLTAETEMGELYVNGNGFLIFRRRHAICTDTRSNTSQATFGDDAAVPTTELPYAAVTPAYDNATLWNGAAIANQGGNLQQAADATSQQLPPDGFGPRVYDSENLIADSDWQSLAYSQYIVQSSKDPELRFATLAVDPIAQPVDLFPQVLGREIGDRITVKRRPPGGGATINRDVFIRGIGHQFTDSTWLTTWVLEDATSLLQPFILDDNTNGAEHQRPRILGAAADGNEDLRRQRVLNAADVNEYLVNTAFAVKSADTTRSNTTSMTADPTSSSTDPNKTRGCRLPHTTATTSRTSNAGLTSPG
jgi:hypothetical protein